MVFSPYIARFKCFFTVRCFMPLLMLLGCEMASAQQSAAAHRYTQFTEGACILISEQMTRFKLQPHLPSYQKAKRDYARHCQQPIVPQHFRDANNLVQTVPIDRQMVSIDVASQKSVKGSIPVSEAPAPTTNVSEQFGAAMPKMPPTTQLPLRTSTFGPWWFWSIILLAGMVVLKFAQPCVRFLVTFTKLLLHVLSGLFAGFKVQTGLLARLFSGASYQQELGRMAEQQLARLLVGSLPSSYRHYHNIIIRTELGDLTEIDHLVVSPYGIFVIEVKNYQGWIFGQERHEYWVVQHFRRKHQVPNPRRQNYKHTQAISHLLAIDEPDKSALIHSVIAFSRRGLFKSMLPDDVMYIDQVAAYIAYKSGSDRKIGDELLMRYHARLADQASQGEVFKAEHHSQLEGQAMLRTLNSRQIRP